MQKEEKRSSKRAAAPMTDGGPAGEAEMAPASTNTVWLVDDAPGILQSITLLLKTVGITTISFRSPSEFLREFSGRSGCIILDIRMPEMSGLEVLRQLQERGVRLPVIFLTGHGDIAMAVRAMRSGVFDFLEKPVDDQVLIDSVLSALNIEAVQRMERASREQIDGRIARLTEKEHLVARLLCEGKSTKEIAAEVMLSARTVEGYRSRIMAKLEVDSFAQMIRALSM